MPKTRTLTPTQVAKVKTLAAQGYATAALASRYGVSITAIKDAIRS